MCTVIIVCGSLMHGDCCRLSARDKLDQFDDTESDIISVTIAFILFSVQDGCTALHKASMNGHLEVVKLLLQFHTDVNIKDKVSTESCTSLASSYNSLLTSIWKY